jgi:predicted SAM-dependent methyltransferase
MEPIRLHLGAFNCGIDGWVNTDITPHIWVSRLPGAALALRLAGRMTAERYAEHQRGAFRMLRYMDLTKPLPFADKSVEAVFSSHVFEHLFADEVQRLVGEIARVLIPGGICRVVVPDLEKIVALYDPADPAEFLHSMFEISKRGEIKDQHHTGFTGQSLASLFLGAGFTRTEVKGYQVGDCPDVALLDNRPESIFFEAVR